MRTKPRYIAKKWAEIKEVLSAAPSTERVTEMLEDAGLVLSDFTKMYSPQKLHDAILYAKDLKDRYTVLWLFSQVM